MPEVHDLLAELGDALKLDDLYDRRVVAGIRLTSDQMDVHMALCKRIVSVSDELAALSV